MEDVVMTKEWFEEQVRAATDEINEAKRFIIMEGLMPLMTVFTAIYILFWLDAPLYVRFLGSGDLFMISSLFIYMAANDFRYIGRQRLRRAITKYHLARIAAHELSEPR